MLLEIDAKLMEDAVFLEVRRLETAGDLAVFRAYHADRDAIYEAGLALEDKDRAFHQAHEKYFLRFGLRERLQSAAMEFPLLERHLTRLVFLKAVAKKEEGGELYVRAEADTGRSVQSAVVRLRPQTLLSPVELAGFLRHEFLHIADMVDPAFGYQPHLNDGKEDSLARKNLVRDRYAVLWDMYIHARLARRYARNPADARVVRAVFDRAFAGLDHKALENLLEYVWNNTSLNHKDLVNLAKGHFSNKEMELCQEPCLQR